MKYENCFVCGKINLEKNEIALSKKLIGRNSKKYFCLNCLAEYLEITPDSLAERIDEFKQQGCSMFI
ncbi:MAG: hypothetical protein Pg6C_05210 [Treponemataceae bacterium]|nr:MAG: hypothetical protein Pg6C_05210 [Treponemataceae bacterium]